MALMLAAFFPPAGAGFSAWLEWLSGWVLVLLIVGVPVYGFLKGVKVYEAFIEGAKEGFAAGVRIIPYLVAILSAVGAFRASGAMDAFARAVAPLTEPLGLPAEVIPLAVVRPFSGGGALFSRPRPAAKACSGRRSTGSPRLPDTALAPCR